MGRWLAERARGRAPIGGTAGAYRSHRTRRDEQHGRRGASARGRIGRCLCGQLAPGRRHGGAATLGGRALPRRVSLARSRLGFAERSRTGRRQSGGSTAGFAHALLRRIRAHLPPGGSARRGSRSHRLPPWRNRQRRRGRGRSLGAPPRGPCVDRRLVRNHLASACAAARSGPYARNRRRPAIGAQAAHDVADGGRYGSEDGKRCHTGREGGTRRDSGPGTANASPICTGARSASASSGSGDASRGRNDYARYAPRSCRAAPPRAERRSTDIARSGRTAHVTGPAGQAASFAASPATGLVDDRAFGRQADAWQSGRGVRTRASEASSRRRSAGSACEASCRRIPRARQARTIAAPEPDYRPAPCRLCRGNGAQARSDAHRIGTCGSASEPGASSGSRQNGNYVE